MEKLFISAIALFSTIAICGQSSNTGSGRIYFEERSRIELKLEGDAEGLASRLPRERKAEKILVFNSDAMLFENGNSVVDDEMANQHDDGNLRINMIVSGENRIYTDLKTKKVIEQKDFMNRIFLVEKDIPQIDWKMTGNQKEILGYTCYEATKTDTAGLITTAWFTPDIKIEGGPQGLGSLPGMILEADINKGSRIYTAKSIESLKPEEMKIHPPKDGRKISEEEYKKLVAEKLKEMGMEEGGGNQMRIVIRHQ